MQSRKVFIDESGDENLNVQSGASRFYVLAAVLVDDSRAAEFLLAAESLRKRYFQSGEIKSSKVGDDHDRRRKILAYARQNLPSFAVVAYRVRKELINNSGGLRFPKSFIKYFARDFSRYLPVSGVAEVSIDEKGRQKFKTEFVTYLKKHFPDDELFSRKTFKTADSRSCVGIQLADFYAGSVAKLIDGDASACQSLFAEVSNACCTWDFPKPKLWGTGGFEALDKFDVMVRSESLARATRYVEEHQDGTEDSMLRTEFLKILIDHFMNGDSDFVNARHIEERLNQLVEKPMNGQSLRNRVVGPLRDAGLLISSKSSGIRPGYKMPESVSDIEGYLDLASAQIIPSLKRVKSAVQIVSIATNGEINLLAQERFSCMQDLIRNV